MFEVIHLLDEEFSRYLGCEPAELRCGGVTVLSGRAPLTIAVTAAGGLVSSSVVEGGRLGVILRGCEKSDLLGRPTLRRLIGLLPVRQKPWTISEENVLYYCTGETFRHCAGPAEPVRPDAPLWRESAEAERESAEARKRRHVDAAFAIYIGAVRASAAKLIDQGRHPFRAVGIDTTPEFRGRGFAKACVSAVTAWAIQHDLVPLYNTQTFNLASMAVAQALGYAEYIRYVQVT